MAKKVIMQNQIQFKFFIVDDDIFCANMYRNDLQNMGFTDISCFNNGTDCLIHLKQNPDIIFLDHNMEDITGFEVLKKVKMYNPNIIVVMISGQEIIKIAVDALKYGAFDYIIKDHQVNENIIMIINKISRIKAESKKSKPNLFRRLFG